MKPQATWSRAWPTGPFTRIATWGGDTSEPLNQFAYDMMARALRRSGYLKVVDTGPPDAPRNTEPRSFWLELL